MKRGKPTSLELHFDPLFSSPTLGDPYVSPTVLLDFGARSTGEPHGRIPICCEAADALDQIEFPTATPLVMDAERTFWEKATAIHVFCRKGQWGSGDGARYARHWHDLDQMMIAGVGTTAIGNRDLAMEVVQHKRDFWRTKDSAGQYIDYTEAINGNLQLVPTGRALEVLEADYTPMVQSGMLRHQPQPPTFHELMERTSLLEKQSNDLARNEP